ncbi:very short patch repair endonuclease [Desulfoluna butyratoxydans]|uniref:very short patch repair endonuclease n=1 Tax=Desulfoluna butyratoxydans TaxID=231438 RepID=UPI0015D3AD3C|nr:DNA mismatch endonuclease Vsr [Desulfoluna butyratoxydans]
MVDTLTKNKRSWNMSRIGSKDTKPELRVRSFLHKNGFRFRLHVKCLPGKPDIVLAKYKTVVFVHGCFWHQHKNCKYAYKPKTRIAFWEEKFRKNIQRDKTAKEALKRMQWTVITVWECNTKDENSLKKSLQKLFDSKDTQKQ